VGGESGLRCYCTGLPTTGQSNSKKQRAEAKFEAKCAAAAQKAVDERIAYLMELPIERQVEMYTAHGYDPDLDRQRLVAKTGRSYDRIVAQAYATCRKKVGRPMYPVWHQMDLERQPGYRHPRGTFAGAADLGAAEFRARDKALRNAGAIRAATRTAAIAPHASNDAASVAATPAPARAPTSRPVVQEFRVTRSTTAAAAAAAVAAAAAPNATGTAGPSHHASLISDNEEDWDSTLEEESEWEGSDDDNMSSSS
jgi:hypothetical protein